MSGQPHAAGRARDGRPLLLLKEPEWRRRDLNPRMIAVAAALHTKRVM